MLLSAFALLLVVLVTVQIARLRKDVEARLDRIERTLAQASQREGNADSVSTHATSRFRLLDD